MALFQQKEFKEDKKIYLKSFLFIFSRSFLNMSSKILTAKNLTPTVILIKRRDSRILILVQIQYNQGLSVGLYLERKTGFKNYHFPFILHSIRMPEDRRKYSRNVNSLKTLLLVFFNALHTLQIITNFFYKYAVSIQYFL